MQSTNDMSKAHTFCLFICLIKKKNHTRYSRQNIVILLNSTAAGRGAGPSTGGPPATAAAAGSTDSGWGGVPQDPRQQRGRWGWREAEGRAVQGPAHADPGARELVLLPPHLGAGRGIQPVALGVGAWTVFQRQSRGERASLVSSQSAWQRSLQQCFLLLLLLAAHLFVLELAMHQMAGGDWCSRSCFSKVCSGYLPFSVLCLISWGNFVLIKQQATFACAHKSGQLSPSPV